MTENVLTLVNFLGLASLSVNESTTQNKMMSLMLSGIILYHMPGTSTDIWLFLENQITKLPPRLTRIRQHKKLKLD